MAELVNQLTVQDLYANHCEKLSLQWVAGQQGGSRSIVPEDLQVTGPNMVNDDLNEPGNINPAKNRTFANQSLVGYLNLIHPQQIQVLGTMELKYIEGLRDISRQDAIKQLFDHSPACIIVAEDGIVPIFLKRKCNENSIPLFKSALSSSKITESLHYYLTALFADVLTMHGVYMEVHAIGVLITGPSGVGKSEVALELITRGHRLVADDAPQFSRISPDIIDGTCPSALQDILEVRGLGIINVRELFGDGAIKTNKYLRLIIRLEPLNKDSLIQIDRLEGSYRTQCILDLDIPEITLPVAPGRNLAVLLECAARNHMLRMSGYTASDEFSERQRILLKQGNH
jgi:HPr kinase/phosphorylase